MPALVEKTAKAFADLGRPWELVYVDDGSTDGTAAAVEAEATSEPRVRPHPPAPPARTDRGPQPGLPGGPGRHHRVPPGRPEFDPEVDVPLLLGRLDQGHDVVAGWRQGRRDAQVVAS